jgi:5'-nucleotidase
MRILIDMDNVLVDFLGGLSNELFFESGLRLNAQKITEFYKMEDGIEGDREGDIDLKDIFFQVNFFAGLRPMPGAIEAAHTLMMEGHEVLIVTSPCTNHSASEKLWWLANWMPFIPRKNIFICHYKGYIKGDVLIDDAPHNIQEYRQENPGALTLVPGYRFNEGLGDLNIDHRHGVTMWEAFLNEIRRRSAIKVQQEK